MPKLSPNQVPTYRLHKQSGQGVVTLSGRDVLLGIYGSPASREKYNRVVGEWQANGRTLPALTAVAVNVDMLVIAFWKHAQTYYPDPEGKPERDHYKGVLRILRKLYADAPAAAFGPLALRAVREEMIALGWARPYVNRQVGRLRRVFKWAAEREMVPAAAWHALQAVEGLRQGKTDAPEPDPVRPVPEVRGCNGKVMVSGYECDLYRQSLSDWTRRAFELPNNAAGGKSKRRMTEVLWCNF